MAKSSDCLNEVLRANCIVFRAWQESGRGGESAGGGWVSRAPNGSWVSSHSGLVRASGDLQAGLVTVIQQQNLGDRVSRPRLHGQ